MHLLVTIVWISVVTSERCQEAKANSIGEEDLRASIHPHLHISDRYILVRACLEDTIEKDKSGHCACACTCALTCGSESREISG